MACRRSAVRSRLAPPSPSPSSRGLGHRPFTAVTGVRIPLGTPQDGHRKARIVDAGFVVFAPRTSPLHPNPSPRRGEGLILAPRRFTPFSPAGRRAGDEGAGAQRALQRLALPRKASSWRCTPHPNPSPQRGEGLDGGGEKCWDAGAGAQRAGSACVPPHRVSMGLHSHGAHPCPKQPRTLRRS